MPVLRDTMQTTASHSFFIFIGVFRTLTFAKAWHTVECFAGHSPATLETTGSMSLTCCAITKTEETPHDRAVIARPCT